MQFIVKGNHFKSVTIDMLKQTGIDKPELFFQLMAKDVFITKVASKGGEDGAVTQDIEMVFKEVALGYKPQKLKGGGLDTPVPFGWDIGKMETEGVPEASFTPSQ